MCGPGVQSRETGHPNEPQQSAADLASELRPGSPRALGTAALLHRGCVLASTEPSCILRGGGLQGELSCYPTRRKPEVRQIQLPRGVFLKDKMKPTVPVQDPHSSVHQWPVASLGHKGPPPCVSFVLAEWDADAFSCASGPGWMEGSEVRGLSGWRGCQTAARIKITSQQSCEPG